VGADYGTRRSLPRAIAAARTLQIADNGEATLPIIQEERL
jgi:hypothetical protein